eukprot:713770-Amphidinium_carterae.1
MKWPNSGHKHVPVARRTSPPQCVTARARGKINNCAQSTHSPRPHYAAWKPTGTLKVASPQGDDAGQTTVQCKKNSTNTNSLVTEKHVFVMT